jgi:RimJ/RimL family protein N-acetyltransferase
MLNWIIRRRDTDDAIGFTQATLARSSTSLAVGIAWLVALEHQNNGFATEAAGQMREWLRQQGVITLIAYIHPNNNPSDRVAHKLGLHATDVMVDGEVRWATGGSSA